MCSNNVAAAVHQETILCVLNDCHSAAGSIISCYMNDLMP